ncbi:MAG: Hsp20/alpha crystallin family protein [Thermofilaceae archaeon]
MEEWFEETMREMRREIRRFMREFEELLKPLIDTDTGEIEPLYEVLKGPDKITIRVDLPRVRREDIEIYRTEDRLIVRAKMSNPLNLCDIPAYSGCEIRGYRLDLELPPNVDTERIQAIYRKGYLEIILPKHKAYRVKVE